jgi:hypothetical protein
MQFLVVITERDQIAYRAFGENLCVLLLTIVCNSVVSAVRAVTCVDILCVQERG